MEYYGNEDVGGVNGHFYHVFNTVWHFFICFERRLIYCMQPLYYGLPAGAVV
jgi:hypothetical protein